MSARRGVLSLLCLGAIGSSAVAPAPVSAQVTKVRDLAFGTVITGTTTAVSVTGLNAAMWQIHVTLLAALGTVSLTLPTSLARSGGGTAMPVTFCATCGRYRVNSSN